MTIARLVLRQQIRQFPDTVFERSALPVDDLAAAPYDQVQRIASMVEVMSETMAQLCSRAAASPAAWPSAFS